LLFRAGPPPLGVLSLTYAGGHAGASRGDRGCRETPPIRLSMLLTIKDLAKQLQIKSSTLYAWVAQGKIPSLKINGLIRFDPGTIDRWVKSSAFMASDRDLLTPAIRSGQDIDVVIARAKRAVYTPANGRPDQDRAKTKEVGNGSV